MTDRLALNNKHSLLLLPDIAALAHYQNELIKIQYKIIISLWNNEQILSERIQLSKKVDVSVESMCLCFRPEASSNKQRCPASWEPCSVAVYTAVDHEEARLRTDKRHWWHVACIWSCHVYTKSCICSGLHQMVCSTRILMIYWNDWSSDFLACEFLCRFYL